VPAGLSPYCLRPNTPRDHLTPCFDGLQGSHTGPTPVMLWRGSPAVGQPLTLSPPPSPAGYWPSPPPAGYWTTPPPIDHPGQNFNTPSPPSGQGYWSSPPWAPPAGGQAPPWGMPLWTTLTPQRSSSSPLTVIHLCLLSIVPFVIRVNAKHLAYSSIYVFNRTSSSARRDFTDGVLNMGGSARGWWHRQ
jgi:hypothetical protein